MVRQSVRGWVCGGVLLALAIGVALGLAPQVALAQTAAAPGSGYVQAGQDWRCMVVNGQTGLNVRSGVGTAFGVLATLQPGTQVQADFSRQQPAEGYQWVPVRFTGGEGWAITSRLTACAPSSDAQNANATPAATVTSSALDGINRDGTLDHTEISLVARSVVLIGNVQRSRIYATGTGTVTTPNGLIVTNAHVVEGADEVAIGVLDDINDPPEFRYLGKVVGIDEDIDVALIVIQSDLDGNPVSAAQLNLPYIPATLHADEVFRGDPVYIFGYPAIGDDYLVVTTGAIVSVENGTISGQRLPVWYRTDAEIAPGNSGGLAVNGNGEFLGIPTFVQTEEETGGRLGGIRPAEVALMAVQDAYASASTAVQPSATPDAAAASVIVTFDSVTLDHGAVVDGQPGIALHVAFTLNGWEQRDATVYAHFYIDDAASTPLINPSAPGQYRDKANQVLTSVPILPCCAQTYYPDLPLFIPYTALGLTQPGTTPLKIQIEVSGPGDAWRRTLSWEFIAYRVG